MSEANGRESKRSEEQRNTAKQWKKLNTKKIEEDVEKRRRNPTVVKKQSASPTRVYAVRACVTVGVEVLRVCGTLFARSRRLPSTLARLDLQWTHDPELVPLATLVRSGGVHMGHRIPLWSTAKEQTNLEGGY